MNEQETLEGAQWVRELVQNWQERINELTEFLPTLDQSRCPPLLGLGPLADTPGCHPL